jgi:drug/metabolite transporter (DMT)-like permease
MEGASAPKWTNDGPNSLEAISDLDSFLQRHWPQGPFNWSLAFGVVLAFLSQLSSIGKGLQKVGVQNLPELSYRPAVLWQYLSSTTWRNGLLLDILGAFFGFISLTILPISIAQPIFCNGLVLLALYSHLYLKEQLGRREWASISMCFSGTVMLAATLVPRDWAQTHVGWLQV